MFSFIHAGINKTWHLPFIFVWTPCQVDWIQLGQSMCYTVGPWDMCQLPGAIAHIYLRPYTDPVPRAKAASPYTVLFRKKRRCVNRKDLLCTSATSWSGYLKMTTWVCYKACVPRGLSMVWYPGCTSIKVNCSLAQLGIYSQLLGPLSGVGDATFTSAGQ